MTINLPDTIKDLYIVGDVHGEWNSVIHNIRQYKIKNSVFIFCGDVGIGFERLKHYTDHVIPELHKVLKSLMIYSSGLEGIMITQYILVINLLILIMLSVFLTIL